MSSHRPLALLYVIQAGNWELLWSVAATLLAGEKIV